MENELDSWNFRYLFQQKTGNPLKISTLRGDLLKRTLPPGAIRNPFCSFKRERKNEEDTPINTLMAAEGDPIYR